MIDSNVTLVTGAAGFIGSHLVESLLADGHHVIGIDNFDAYYSRELKELNLRPALAQSNYSFHEVDIRNQHALVKTLRSGAVTRVVHLAARAGVRNSLEDPAGYADTNVSGTISLMEACRLGGVAHIVFASSSSVYGDRTNWPFREEDSTDWPLSPYAATKKAGEVLCHTYHHLTGISATCLRLFTVYGPRQRPDLAINKFARLLMKNEPIPFFGSGMTQRDYTYVGDTVAGIRAALDRPNGYRIYNLGRSDPITLTDMVTCLERVLSCRARLERHPLPPGDMTTTCADISRATAELGYAPKVSLEEGLRRFIHWLQEVQPHLVA